MRKGLPFGLIPLLLLPGCALFASGPPVLVPSVAGCSSLIPTEWRKPVPSVEPPSPAVSVVADWIASFDGQTGRLDQQYDRTIGAIGIVERCEERDRKAVTKATKRHFFGGG